MVPDFDYMTRRQDMGETAGETVFEATESSSLPPSPRSEIGLGEEKKTRLSIGVSCVL